MNYILITIYILILLISKLAFKRKFGYQWNSTFITTAIWCSFASIAVINPIELRPPSLLVHGYSILFLLSFNITSYLMDNKSIKSVKINNNSIDFTSINIKIATIEVLCIAIVTPLLILGLNAILSGDASGYRMDVYFEVENALFTRVIPSSILNCIMIMSLYIFYRYKKYGHLLNSILIVSILSVMSAGRGTIFCYTILNAFLSTFYRNIGLNRTKIPLYLGAIFICYITISLRNGDMINSLILYFSGSFSFLDYILENPRDYGLETLHYGFITLSPITEPLMYVFKVFGLTTEKIPSYYLNEYVQEFVDIGASGMYLFNNNSTALLNFILDGGWIGVILGGIFLAYISNKSYSYFIDNKFVGAILHLYIINGLFMTTISYQSFMSITPLITFIVALFCSTNFKDVINKI